MDNAATTRTKKKVVDEMLKYFSILYGNPSSVYEFAGKSKEALDNSRHIIAATLGVKDNEIYFTSGGTESDNWALRLAAKSYKDKGKHIITSKIEHHAILRTANNLEDLGYRISYVDVDENGRIKLKQLMKEICDETILISVMMANNEIGTIQPLKEIGIVAKNKNILFHTDAVQAYGQIPINIRELNLDMLSASAHKFNGPKGIGFLYINDNVKKTPLLFGGGQENGLRAGTENVPSIVGMAKAADIACSNIYTKYRKERKMREYFITRILREIPYVRVNGERINRLPGNINMAFQFVNATELLALLDVDGICASGGSACSSSSKEPSHVLMALGLPEELAYSSIRLTISEDTSKEDIDYVVDRLKKHVFDLRKNSEDYILCFSK
jgi:cysteine desulfurase